jgi:hypothetical protein
METFGKTEASPYTVSNIYQMQDHSNGRDIIYSRSRGITSSKKITVFL